MHETVLLDTHATKRRLLQNGLPLIGIALVLAGAALLTESRLPVPAVIAVILGLGMLAWAPRVRLIWRVSYKGHAIRFENHVLFGERLYIDDVRISRGAFGYYKILRGVIRSGEGLGDRITAESEAGLTIFRIRIVAESPAGRG